MKKYWVRSSIFNIAFFGVTAVLSVVYLPLLILPRKMFVGLIKFWLRVVAFLEYTILGLRYQVLGLENLPPLGGSYIVAAKHQSAYETLKLHLIFDDPAIILKKELLMIPLFGYYLKKSGAIAIDRSSPEIALRSVQHGALRVRDEDRPIIIFPQGTRVAIDTTPAQKPYKPGIYRIQDVTNLPIYPLALNSGVFWPRNSWLKRPGTVTFQVLPPIRPGEDRQTLMAELEEKIESATSMLVDQARPLRSFSSPRVAAFKKFMLFVLFLMACGFYTLWWNMVTETIQREYAAVHDDSALLPEITGFPIMMKIRLPREVITTTEGNIVIEDIYAYGLPLPFAPVEIATGKIMITNHKWTAPLILDSLLARVSYTGQTLYLKDSLLSAEDFRAAAEGTIDLTDPELPVFDLALKFRNHEGFLAHLSRLDILKEKTAKFMSAAFTGLMDEEGVVAFPVTQQGRTLYTGPFALVDIPQTKAVTVARPLVAKDTPRDPFR
jgi:1-acyl-sn-glycerol-3-phosphate acyltransferase